MNRIGDLQTLFTATQHTDATSNSKQHSSSVADSGTDRALGSIDSSVVSSAGNSIAAALGQSDVRTDKIARLQAAIANGTYNVSSGDVAQSLINSLLGRN